MECGEKKEKSSLYRQERFVDVREFLEIDSFLQRQQEENLTRYAELFHLVMTRIARTKTWMLKPDKFKVGIKHGHCQ